MNRTGLGVVIGLAALSVFACGDDDKGTKDTADTAEVSDTAADTSPADTADTEPADTEPADTEPADTADTADTVEPLRLRMQAGFPVLPAHADSSLDSALQLLLEPFGGWAKRVEEMTGGAVVIDILPCCDTAATGAVHEAVSTGEVLDGAQGLAAYLYNTSSRLRRTAGLFDGGWSELDSRAFLQWMESGGGQELYDELMTSLGYNVVIIPFGPLPPQNFGWFPSELSGPEELVGLKYRTAGIANEMAGELGMVPTAVGAGALVGALGDGSLHAAEFNTAASDLALGLHAAVQTAPCAPDDDCSFVYHTGGLGQVAEWFDLVINRDVYDALSPEQQQILREAAVLAGEELEAGIAAADLEALPILEDHVKVVPVPASIVQAEREAWTRVIDCPSSEPDDLFCRVVDSVEAYAGCAVDDSAPAIKIGELYDGGGGSKQLFDTLPPQMELVLAEVNAGCGTVGSRRMGARVERILVNTEDNAALAGPATSDVISQGAVFVSGEQGSATAVLSAEVAISDHSVVYAASLASTDALSGCTAGQLADPLVEKVATPVDEVGKCWDNKGLFYRTTVTSTGWGSAVASYVVSTYPEITTGAVLYRDDAFGKAATRGFEQSFEANEGKSVIVTVPFPGGADKDGFKALLATLVAGNPKVIPGVFRIAEFRAFLEAWAETEASDAAFLAAHGDVRFMALGTVRADNSALSEGARTLLANRVVGLTPYYSDTSVGFQKWFEVFQAADPAAAATYHGQPRAYDAAMLFMLALTKANSTDSDAIAVAIKLVANPPGEMVYPGEFAKARKLIFEGKDINYEGASGPVDLDDAGNIGPAPYLVYTGNPDGSIKDLGVYTP